MRHVWFKLPNLPVEFTRMIDGVDRIRDLRDRVLSQYRAPRSQDQVKFYASPADQRASQPLDLDAKVDGLGVELEHPILVDSPGMFTRFIVCVFGLRLDGPRLERTQLVDKLSNTLLRNGQRFVLLSAPHASGKMSISSLFAHRHPELSYKQVLLIRGSSPNDAMRRAGLDICAKQSFLSQDQEHLILIYDAQRNYDDKAFWKALITDAPSWLPSNIRFIISTSHTLEPGVESPMELQSVPTLGRTDFLLSEEESREFLELLPALGLPEKMKDDKDKLAQLLVRECGGLIGALRVAVTSLSIAFRENPTPSESELMAYFLSYKYQDTMDRCFCRPSKPTSKEFYQFLTKCLALSPDAVPLDEKLARENRECFLLLQKTGVLVREGEQLVRFSSPLAERFYYRRLVREFARVHPKSLRELVQNVLGSLSASALRAGAEGGSGFPDEVTFRQQLMRACTANTDSECPVCPDLPRIFPTAADEGGIAYFVNGTQKWGLEFFVDGRNIQEYTSRFASGGAFAALEADDYAVIDLRGNATGIVPGDVALKQKLITVFFKSGNFSRCQCVFGRNGARCDIILS